MNEEIEQLFEGFTVDGKNVPVALLFYSGQAESYVTYQETGAGDGLFGDDGLIGFVPTYDFDIYSKTNYRRIEKRVKEILEGAGWTWQPSFSSGDQFERDTGFYHKTLQFSIHKEV